MKETINLKFFCPRVRKQIVEQYEEGLAITVIAKNFKTSRRTVYRWVKRYDPNSQIASLSSKKSSPIKRPRKTPKSLERLVIALRDKKGWSSLKIHLFLKNKYIINPSTNCYLSEYAIRTIFDRYKRGYQFDKKKIKKAPIIRYEKESPGELVHIDVKKLKNIKGQNAKNKKYEIAIIDDCTRIVYAEILPNKNAKTTALFFSRAVKWFLSEYNIKIKAVLSDNGKEFTWHNKESLKFHPFELVCNLLNINHKYTKIRRPQTNGKIERLWKTYDREFFTQINFLSHEHRNKEFQKYLYYYNNKRMHMSLNGFTPVEKLAKVNACA